MLDRISGKLEKLDERIITSIENDYFGITESYKQYKQEENEPRKTEILLLVIESANTLQYFLANILKIYENDTDEEDLYYIERINKYYDNIVKFKEGIDSGE